MAQFWLNLSNNAVCDDNMLLNNELNEPMYYTYFSIKKSILNTLIYSVLLNYKFIIVKNLSYKNKVINLNNLEITKEKNLFCFLLLYINNEYYSIICYKNNFDLNNLNFDINFINLNSFLDKIDNNSFKLNNIDKNYVFSKTSLLISDLKEQFLSCYPWVAFSKNILLFDNGGIIPIIDANIFHNKMINFYKQYNLDLEIGMHPLDPKEDDENCPIFIGWDIYDSNYLLPIVNDELQIWFENNNFNKV